MPPAPPAPALVRAIARVRAGQLADGLLELQALHRGHRDDLSPEQQATLLGALIECRLARGDLADAMALGEELPVLLAGAGLSAALAHHARGELVAALGDAEAAAYHFTTAGECAPDAPVDRLPWRGGAALAHLRTGEARLAGGLALEQVRLAEAQGSPYALAGALRTLAVVDTGPDRVQHLLRARAVLAATLAERLAAQIDTDLAGLLMLRVDPDARARAAVLLRSAEEVSSREELWPLHGRVRRLLDRLGERPRAVRSEVVAGLTVAEKRVARLAAEGLSNREVAAELEVSVKAIEWHLSHVYRKLGIASRTDLVTALGATA